MMPSPLRSRPPSRRRSASGIPSNSSLSITPSPLRSRRSSPPPRRCGGPLPSPPGGPSPGGGPPSGPGRRPRPKPSISSGVITPSPLVSAGPSLRRIPSGIPSNSSLSRTPSPLRSNRSIRPPPRRLSGRGLSPPPSGAGRPAPPPRIRSSSSPVIVPSPLVSAPPSLRRIPSGIPSSSVLSRTPSPLRSKRSIRPAPPRPLRRRSPSAGGGGAGSSPGFTTGGVGGAG